MKILMILHTGPFDNNTGSLIGIARAARERGDEVTVFAMSEGVENLARKDFAALASAGVRLTVCEKNRLELAAPGGVDGVEYGSQYDLAQYVSDHDRVISFT